MSPRTDVDLGERGLAQRFVRGKGIEIGAAHRPVQVDPAFCSVTYLDRLSAMQLTKRFPELAADEIMSPDIICDVAATGLSCIQDGKLDFVIASHLLEHLPNPLGFLLECHRVLRPSGILLLMVPDKNYTFDRDRQITPLAHIVHDLKNNTTAIDEEHLIDFIVHAAKQTVPKGSRQRRKMFQRELDRSIHVHVWSCNELIELLEYVVGQEATSWVLCELFLPKDIKDESIVVLRKTSADTAQALAHFRQNAVALVARETVVQSLLQDPEPADGQPEAEEGLPARIYRTGHRLLARLHRRSEEPVTADTNTGEGA